MWPDLYNIRMSKPMRSAVAARNPLLRWQSAAWKRRRHRAKDAPLRGAICLVPSGLQSGVE